MEKRNLSKNSIEKYKRIVDEWFINKFNGAAAYRKFYTNIRKDTTATVNFSRLQALPEMKEYIHEKHEAAAKVIDATHEGILKELKNWVESDITETMNLSAEQIKLLPVEVRRLITKYKNYSRNFYDKEGNLTGTEETTELHFVSKERAIDMINKHLGFYEADNKQKANEITIFASNEKHSKIIEGIISGM